MVHSVRSASAVSVASLVAAALAAQPRAADPCVAIAGQTWVAPAAVRACYESFKVNTTEKANILEVTTKMLPFHTSVNYQKLAPLPYTLDVHNDITADLKQIDQTKYSSDYELHIALSRAYKRSFDGHFSYINYCYDSAFVNYLPTPLVVLTDAKGHQTVNIAPEAFTVASAEFTTEVQFWQDALPGALKGQLASFSGAKVLAINGRDPWALADDNAKIAGSYQAYGTRLNGFFASYNRGASSWSYILGQFAQQSLPLSDSATLTIQRVNSTEIETVTVPYRSRIGSATVAFTDGASFRAGNCRAIEGTNGASWNSANSFVHPSSQEVDDSSALRFAQMSQVSKGDVKKHAINVFLDDSPLSNVVLPPTLAPGAGLPGSSGVAQFYMLDNTTGVFALGSFSATSYDGLLNSTLVGLQTLANKGAKKLIVDVTNNGGGYICVAHFVHRIIAGPKSTTEPKAGLDTEIRAGPLAKKIVAKYAANPDLDADFNGLYAPGQWSYANNTKFPANFNYLGKPVNKLINLTPDAFSQRLGDECQPFSLTPPSVALFDPKKVAIVSNGRCASSCSLFSITMAKEEGAKTVVLGGKQDVPQSYCGTVGGQSTDFSTIQSDIKSVGLENDPLSPPDFITQSVNGVTFRLGFGIYNKNDPEEWQSRPANINLPLSADIVNNPVAIWKAVAAKVF